VQHLVHSLFLLLQEAERAELEHVSNHIAAERDSLEAAAAALQEQQQQQSAMAADLAARESAVEARAAALQSQQGALQAAQASALKQLESLEASLKNKLEAHQKQVGPWHACCRHDCRTAPLCLGSQCTLRPVTPSKNRVQCSPTHTCLPWEWLWAKANCLTASLP
jgi:hypothetical protein